MFSRHSWIFAAAFFATTSTLLFASSSAPAAVLRPGTSSSSAVEVAYILSGSTVQTFDVDRTTGSPTEEGSGVTLDPVTNITYLPSVNDEFVYVTGNDSQGVEWLWVYATDSTGVPQLPAVQALNLTDGIFATYDFVLNPNGTLAYAAETAQSAQQFTLVKIVSFTIDPGTGMVTKAAKPVASYGPNGPCLLTASTSYFIYGFNPSGTVMYDLWNCNYPFGSDSGMYYSRGVNQTTGAIGQEKQILAWADSNQGTDAINITPSAIVYFTIPTFGAMSAVNVYSLTGAALFSCGASMVEACGYGTWNYLDPMGKFDLIALGQGVTQITKFEVGAKKIVDTNYFVPGNFLGFAPDDALIYTQNIQEDWLYPIYVFDATTGAVTYMGGTITNYNGVLIPALRQ
jgi:hypothetical protein